MTPQQIDAMKMALEYIEAVPDDRYNAEHLDRDALITAIKEALAEHAMSEVQRLGQEIEQEPVQCKLCNDSGAGSFGVHSKCICEYAKATPSMTEQEPVAWMDADGNVSDNNDHKCFPIPLYTKEQP